MTFRQSRLTREIHQLIWWERYSCVFIKNFTIGKFLKFKGCGSVTEMYCKSLFGDFHIKKWFVAYTLNR